MQHGALVIGRGIHLGDAVHEADMDRLIFETARDGVVMRGFVIAQHRLEGVRVCPGAAGCDFGFRPLGRRAAGDEPGRGAGEGGLAAMPASAAAGDGICDAAVFEGEQATISVECERGALQAQIVGIELEDLSCDAAGQWRRRLPLQRSQGQ